MKIKAEQKNSRQSPRKVRLLANEVKDLSLEEAFVQLSLMERKASVVLLKVLRQAVANATHNHNLQIENLEIDNILVKTGPTYKRMRPVSRGRGHKILKRTCHVEAILSTKEEMAASAAQAAKQTEQSTAAKKEKKQAAKPKTEKKKKSDVKTKAKSDSKAKKFIKPQAEPQAKLKDKDQTQVKNPITKTHRRKSGL